MQLVEGPYVLAEQLLAALRMRPASHLVHGNVPQEVAQEICCRTQIAAVQKVDLHDLRARARHAEEARDASPGLFLASHEGGVVQGLLPGRLERIE